MLAFAANHLVRLFLEPVCCACSTPLDRPLAGPVCDACWRAVPRLTPPWCDRCGDVIASPEREGSPESPASPTVLICARCLHTRPVLSIARSAGRYDGSLRRIIHAFKYDGHRALAAPLARLVREAGADVLAGADAVVPVPLHPWRALRRGFNQADDLARHLGLPVFRALRRVGRGPPQAGLSASNRHLNVQHAFALSRQGRRVLRESRNNSPPRPLTLVLIDDVMTTGETMEGCGKVLAEAGVSCVRGLTIARAVARRHR